MTDKKPSFSAGSGGLVLPTFPSTDGPATSSNTQTPAIKRLKLETLPPETDGALRSASALDPESEDIPKAFKCPICSKVYFGIIFQCSKGHTLCNPCLKKRPGQNCFVSECNGAIKGTDGIFIRNRGLEQILDSFWFRCQYRKNGCNETLAKEDVWKHTQECTYDGKCIQICKFFTGGEKCQFWTRTTKPEDVEKHFREQHGAHTTSLPTVHNDAGVGICKPGVVAMDISNFENGSFASLIVKYDNHYYLIPYGVTNKDILTYLCLQIGPRDSEVRKKIFSVVLKIQSGGHKESNVILTTPTVNILDSLAWLKDPPGGFRVSYVEKNCLSPTKKYSHMFYFKYRVL